MTQRNVTRCSVEELRSNSCPQLQLAPLPLPPQSAVASQQWPLAHGFSTFLSLLEGVPRSCPAEPVSGLLTCPKHAAQVLLPAWAGTLSQGLGPMMRSQLSRWLCLLHPFVEDFLPFTCGHTFTHSLVRGQGGQAPLEWEHGEWGQVQGRAARSPH